MTRFVPYIGFLAAFFSSFTLCPTELIKCKLQAMREKGLIGPNMYELIIIIIFIVINIILLIELVVPFI